MTKKAKAIILAAGRGSRMKGLCDDRPKCLNLVGGCPLIDWQIQALSQAGIRDIAIVTGYLAPKLQKYGNAHFHNDKWQSTNMLYSLFCAKDWLEQFPCIISYADIFYNSKIISDMIKTPANIAISYDKNWYNLWKERFENPLDDAETFQLNADGYLSEIGKKTDDINKIQGQYMGLLKFTPDFVKPYLQKYGMNDFNHMDMTSYLSKLIALGYKIKAIRNNDIWAECDTAHDLAVANELIRKHKISC